MIMALSETSLILPLSEMNAPLPCPSEPSGCSLAALSRSIPLQFQRQRKVKNRPRLPFRPAASPVTFDKPPHRRQADPNPLKFTLAVQPLKQAKQLARERTPHEQPLPGGHRWDGRPAKKRVLIGQCPAIHSHLGGQSD